jgi:mycothiol synthase
MARVFLSPQPEAECRAYLRGQIHPEHRGRGLGEFVLSWMEARGGQRLHEMPDGLPHLLRTNCQDNVHDSIALFERHGFRPVRYHNRMRRDLSQPIPDVSVPDGLTLRPYSREFDRSAWEALNESFRDHWSFEPVTDEEWQMFFIGRSTFRPDMTFLAVEGNRVVGLCFTNVNPEANERQGIKEGWIDDVAVRRPWRKRGVAYALLCQSMRAMKADGLDYATLGVDTENPTGALGLYERLGFVAVRRMITFEKPYNLCTMYKATSEG